MAGSSTGKPLPSFFVQHLLTSPRLMLLFVDMRSPCSWSPAMVRGGSMRRSSPPPGGRAGGVASSCGRRPGALSLDHGRRHHLLRLRLGHCCSRLQSLAIRARTPLLPPPVLTGDSRRPHLLQHWLSLFPVPILASWVSSWRIIASRFPLIH